MIFRAKTARKTALKFAQEARANFKTRRRYLPVSKNGTKKRGRSIRAFLNVPPLFAGFFDGKNISPLCFGGFPMNKLQKQQVLALRGSGESCAKIADKLGISVNTVKSFCRRNSIDIKEETNIKTVTETASETTGSNSVCPQCGNAIIQIKGRKPKRFCSDDCRAKWWNSHSDSVNQKALYSFECACCGKAFTAYGNSKRRYCSHSCYCASRYNKAVTV